MPNTPLLIRILQKGVRQPMRPTSRITLEYTAKKSVFWTMAVAKAG